MNKCSRGAACFLLLASCHGQFVSGIVRLAFPATMNCGTETNRESPKTALLPQNLSTPGHFDDQPETTTTITRPIHLESRWLMACFHKHARANPSPINIVCSSNLEQLISLVPRYTSSGYILVGNAFFQETAHSICFKPQFIFILCRGFSSFPITINKRIFCYSPHHWQPRFFYEQQGTTIDELLFFYYD